MNRRFIDCALHEMKRRDEIRNRETQRQLVATVAFMAIYFLILLM